MYVARHKEKFIKTGRRRTQPPLIDFQNEIVEKNVARGGVEEGVEMGRRWRFITWTVDRRLGKKSHTFYHDKVQTKRELGFLY